MAFTPIMVTRQYYDADLSAASGRVHFTPTSVMINEGTVVAGPVTGELDPTGRLEVLLAANTDPDTVPSIPDFASYRVVEQIDGQPRREYFVQIPHDAPNGAVDLELLNILPVPPVVTYPAPGPQGPPGADSTVPGPPGADGQDGQDGADGVGVPAGGSVGQYLRKASGDDYDTAWSDSDAVPLALVEGKGDLLVGLSEADVARLPVGATGQTLTAAPSAPEGVAWQANPTPAVVPLNEASIAIDAAAGKVFDLTATANRTLPSPTNAIDGRAIIVRHRASGGSRTLGLTTGSPGSYKVPTDFTVTATPAGTCDHLAFLYDGTQQRWILVGYVKGA